MLKEEQIFVHALDLPQCLTYVAERDNDIIEGFFTLHDFFRFILLEHFLVKEKIRKGLSRLPYRLVNRMKEEVNCLGYKQLLINLGEEKTRACKFTERMFTVSAITYPLIKNSPWIHKVYLVEV
jgi:hypothetical protein